MASTQSKLFHFLLRFIHKKKYLRQQLATRTSSFFDRPKPTSKVKKCCHIQQFRVNGHNVYTLTPKHRPGSGMHVLYLHGGAYVQCFNVFHWNFFAQLIQHTGCAITAPDYPFAPVYTYREAFAMVSVLYRQVMEAIGPQHLILMGDSAGGGFALALAQKMRNDAQPQPNRIILLSPWLDIQLENAAIAAIDPLDPFLDKQSLQQAGRLYAGDTDPAHYLLSPINGSLDHLGKLSVFAGTKEILVADTRKLKARADARKIPIDYYEYAGMFHGWMFLNFPEARKARQQIIALLEHPA